MAVSLCPIINGTSVLGSTGLPLSGGQIYTYQAGTTTPQATYTTSAGNIQNANPIILNPDGRPPQEIWLTQGQAYKLVVLDALSNPVATYDNISGVTDSSATLSAFIASLAASSGSGLVGFSDSISYTSGTIGKALLDRGISITDAPYNADPTGITDSTTAIQTALNASTVVRVPKGTYILSSTLTAQPNTLLYGDDADLCVFTRTGNYGDTLVCGSSVQSAGSFTVRGIWFNHSTQYVQGTNSLPNLATTGAHIRLWGAQNCKVEGCYFWRLPQAITCHGGSLFWIERNTFIQTWDPNYAAAQEGKTGLYMDATTAWGNPKDLTLIGNTFLGTKSAARTHSLTDANGHNLTPTMQDNIGPQQHVYINGCETIHAEMNYFGTASDADVFLNPVSGSGFIANARFVNNFFDGAWTTHFRAQIQSGAQPILHLELSDNDINGELNSYQGISILAFGGAPSVYDFRFTDNTINALYGGGGTISGAVGFHVQDNTITNYNCLGVTPSSAPVDAQFAAAMYLQGPDTAEYYGYLDGNEVGGGGNVFSGTHNCWLPFYLDATSDKIRQGRCLYLGIGSPSQIGVSEDIPQTVTGTAALQAFVRTVYLNVSAPATVSLPQNPANGQEITFKDIAGNVGTNNVTLSASPGTINGAGTLVLNSNNVVQRIKANSSNGWFLL